MQEILPRNKQQVTDWKVGFGESIGGSKAINAVFSKPILEKTSLNNVCLACDLNDEQIDFLNKISKERDLPKSELLSEIVKMAMNGQHIQTGPRDKTLDTIDKVVKKQMSINETTQASISVGTGKNRKEVRYEQRTITTKWIMDNVSPMPRFESVQAYIEANKEAIEKHNEWLVDSNNYYPNMKDKTKKCIDTQTRVSNFNRQTAKNHKIANQIGYEGCRDKLNGDQG